MDGTHDITLNKRHWRSGLELMVSKLAYWVELDDEDQAAVLALPHHIKRLAQHDHIIREGDPPRSSCVMLSGYSIRHKIVGEGYRQIVAIHLAGDLVDLQNALLGVSDHSVQMLTDGEVAMIPRDEIVRLAFERPAVGRAMWMDTLVDAAIFREWIANVGRRDARTRVAHLLCEFGLRLKVAGLGTGENYNLPMSQEQLADTTGLTSVHINRTMRLLEAQGLITRSSPRSIIVTDWQRLADAGDFDARYLHLRDEDPAVAR